MFTIQKGSWWTNMDNIRQSGPQQLIANPQYSG